MGTVVKLLAGVTALLALSGLGYYLFCLWSVRAFRCDCRRMKTAAFTPPVSILKPLRGTDPEMYSSFRSHCLQDYPEYEIIFGVSDAKDPAIAEVERLQREFPESDIRLVICDQHLGTNVKVSNLVQMLPHARHGHLLINDSDIRVGPDYLRRVMAPLADEQVGMVTTLYRGIPGKTIGSQLESLGIATDFAAGVLAARSLEGIHFALGSTLAFSRRALENIGGFEPLLDYLADDFELGNRLANQGFEIVLSDAVVDTFLPHYDFKAFWTHQLRWARGMRDARKWGYTGLVITHGLPWALLTVVLSRGSAWSWLLLLLVAVMRYAMASATAASVLRYPHWIAQAWLIPLRDCIALLIWAASFAGHKVAWRGDVFVLEDGKLRPA